MENFEIRFKKSVTKDLRRIPNKDVKRLLMRIDALAENPRPCGCEKLTAQERYRIRQGIYRVIYEIRDQQLIIVIVKVSHRSNVYSS